AYGVLQAILLAARPRTHPFTALEQARLATIASSVAVFIQTMNAEHEHAQEHEALVAGPHDQLFNQEALEAHRAGVKAGPMVEVPNDGWWALFSGTVRQLLARRSAKRLQFIQQLEASDCGAACLAMVLEHLGSELPVSDIRKMLNAGPSGVSLSALLELASQFGLLGRALRVQPHQFNLLASGMVLHWEFNHLVVFESMSPDGFVLLDPAVGRRVVSVKEFSARFTGVALELFPNTDFTPVRKRGHPTLQYVTQIFQHPQLLRRALGASLLVQVFGMALPLLTAVVIDRVLPQANLGLLGLVALGAVCAALFGSFADLARSYALVRLRAQFDQAATFKFVDHLLSLPYTFFQQRSPGDLMLRVYANSSIREILSSTVLSAALDGGMAILYAVVLLYLAPPLAAIAFVIGLLQVALVLATRRSLSELMAAEWSSRSRANSKLVQVLHGIQTLKGAGAEAEGFRFWAGDFADELNSVNRRQIYKARLDAVTHFFQNGSPAIMLCIGALLVVQGSIPLGGMLAAATLSAAFLRPLMELVRNSISLLEVRVHVERIHDVVSAQPESTDGAVRSALTSGEVEVQGVKFTYPGQDVPVCENISFKVRAGQSIALVGETGCGKSTLIHLILGFYPCDAGCIRFDGQDSTDLNIKALRRQIGYVPQNPYLFEGSIRDNIALSHPEASLAEIIEAARVACIHDEIMVMDNGYDTRLIP
ncbi:MAG: peptidase domain-containing ABC transporter, partial [Betaproteobacteria bacterium]